MEMEEELEKLAAVAKNVTIENYIKSSEDVKKSLETLGFAFRSVLNRDHVFVQQLIPNVVDILYHIYENPHKSEDTEFIESVRSRSIQVLVNGIADIEANRSALLNYERFIGFYEMVFTQKENITEIENLLIVLYNVTNDSALSQDILLKNGLIDTLLSLFDTPDLDKKYLVSTLENIVMRLKTQPDLISPDKIDNNAIDLLFQLIEDQQTNPDDDDTAIDVTLPTLNCALSFLTFKKFEDIVCTIPTPTTDNKNEFSPTFEKSAERIKKIIELTYYAFDLATQVEAQEELLIIAKVVYESLGSLSCNESFDTLILSTDVLNFLNTKYLTGTWHKYLGYTASCIINNSYAFKTIPYALVLKKTPNIIYNLLYHMKEGFHGDGSPELMLLATLFQKSDNFINTILSNDDPIIINDNDNYSFNNNDEYNETEYGYKDHLKIILLNYIDKHPRQIFKICKSILSSNINLKFNNSQEVDESTDNDINSYYNDKYIKYDLFIFNLIYNYLKTNDKKDIPAQYISQIFQSFSKYLDNLSNQNLFHLLFELNLPMIINKSESKNRYQNQIQNQYQNQNIILKDFFLFALLRLDTFKSFNSIKDQDFNGPQGPNFKLAIKLIISTLIDQMVALSLLINNKENKITKFHYYETENKKEIIKIEDNIVLHIFHDLLESNDDILRLIDFLKQVLDIARLFTNTPLSSSSSSESGTSLTNFESQILTDIDPIIKQIIFAFLKNTELLSFQIINILTQLGLVKEDINIKNNDDLSEMESYKSFKDLENVQQNSDVLLRLVIQLFGFNNSKFDLNSKISDNDNDDDNK